MMNSKISITVFTRNCTFTAEIPRHLLSDVISDMDKEFDRIGITKNPQKRVTAMMQQVAETSDNIANNEIDQQTGSSEVAMGFFYAFVKEKSIEDLLNTYALVVCLYDNRLYMNPCTNEEIYQKIIASVRIKADKAFEYDDELVDITPKKTIH